MINLFTNITSDDQSIKYLGQIFGNMSGVIPTGDEITVLGTMFRAFNSVVLAIGALIIIYVTVIGVMQTAHEGEFMGKKWNNIWVPIRTVLGIATLIPTVSGFSVIQIVMMWVILQGVGAANFLWATALGAIDTLGSPYAQADVNPPSGNVKPALQALFQMLTCDATAQISATDPQNMDGGGYYCSTGNYCSASLPTANENSTKISFGPNGSCGKITYCNQAADCADATSTKCYTCKAQIQALNQVIKTFSGIASQFANADLAYRDFYVKSKDTSYQKASWIDDFCTKNNIENCCIPASEDEKEALGGDCKATSSEVNRFPLPNGGDKPYDPANTSQGAVDMFKSSVLSPYFPSPTSSASSAQGDFIDVAINEYTTLMKSAVASAIAAKGASGTPLSAAMQQAKSDGWLLAGSYYYSVAQVNSGTLQASVPSLEPESTTVDAPMKSYRNNYVAAGQLVGAVTGGAASDIKSGAQSVTENGLQSVAEAFNVMGNPGSSINPLAQLQIAGYTMIMSATIMYFAFLAITIAIGIGGNLSFWVAGFGAVNPVGPASMLAYLIVVPALYALLGILISLGGLLGIYIPLIPFIIFSFGAIGWFIAVIETMVAGPLVALGILSPSGQSELLGQAQPALGLLFNVFLRPSLMIFGLITSMLLASVVVLMLNYAFWNPVFVGVFSFGKLTTNAGGYVAASLAVARNPVAFILFLAAYVMTVVAAVNKCFSLIHILPAQVMSWIGIQGMPGGGETGETALSAAKGATEKAGGMATSGMTTSVTGAAKVGKERFDTKGGESKMTTKESGGGKKK